MKHLHTFESFRKVYGEKIKPEQFKQIKKGKKLYYLGGLHTVVDNDGYILTLKNDEDDLIKVNLGQFNHGGQINEARSIEKIEKDRTKVVNDMTTTVARWKDAKAKGDKDAENSLLKRLKELTTSKKALEDELNLAIAGKDRYVELVVTENNAEFRLDEASIKTINMLFKNKGMIDAVRKEHADKIRKAINQEGISTDGISDKELIQIAKELLDESAILEEELTDKTIHDIWFDVHGKKLINEYPKIAKILKNRPNVDRNEFARICSETYDEDFKSKFPKVWDSLK